MHHGALDEETVLTGALRSSLLPFAAPTLVAVKPGLQLEASEPSRVVLLPGHETDLL